jgi:hypothetical protein
MFCRTIAAARAVSMRSASLPVSLQDTGQQTARHACTQLEVSEGLSWELVRGRESCSTRIMHGSFGCTASYPRTPTNNNATHPPVKV